MGLESNPPQSAYKFLPITLQVSLRNHINFHVFKISQESYIRLHSRANDLSILELWIEINQSLLL